MTSVSISTTKNTVTVDEDNPSVITVATLGPQGPAVPDGDKGDITVSNNGTVMSIDAGVVSNSQIASDAAISLSKLATGALPTGITVASANIPDLTIVNSDISASAAIAGTKISPDFGSQNIVTTGNITIADVTAASLDISGNADIDGTLEADAYTVNGTALNEYIADTVGAMVSGNTETNIAVTYDDADNTLDFSVVNITGNAASADTIDVGNTSSLDATRYLTFVDTDGSARSLNIDGSLFYNSSSNQLNVGAVVAGTFSGSGASLTSLPAGQLTGAIANGVTATTQSASDNSTKVATTAYTDTAIANLVDSSPSALNTLNELAAALGDDANFSTTVTNSIATKLPLAGGTLTGNVIHNDSVKAIFGTDSDFQLFHNNTRAKIQNNTGELRICSDVIELKNYDDDANYLSFASGGNATFAGDVTTNGDNSFNGANYNSWWDKSDSAFKFDDNAKLKVGTGGDLEIYHDGTHNYIKGATSGQYTYLQNVSGSVYIQSVAGENSIWCGANGAVELYHDNSKKFETNSSGTKTWGGHIMTNGGTVTGGDLSFADSSKAKFGDGNDLQIYHDGTDSFLDNSTGELTPRSDVIRLRGKTANDTLAVFVEGGASKLYFDGSNKFETTAGGTSVTGTLDTTGTITGGGHIKTGSDTGYFLAGASNDLRIFHDGTDNVIDAATSQNVWIKNNAGSVNEAMGAFRANGASELYYDGSKKLETYADGIKVYDDVWVADNGVIRCGTRTAGGGGDLKIYHDGTSNYIDIVDGQILYFREGGDNKFYVQPGGVQFVGSLYGDDNNKIELGNDQDLKIYHNGSHNIIEGVTSGQDLYIGVQNEGDEVGFLKSPDTEWMVRAIVGSYSALYYDGSKKIQTASHGIDVLDDLVFDNGTNAGKDINWSESTNTLLFQDSVYAAFGASSDLQIYHDGNHSQIKDSGTGNLQLLSSAFKALASDGSETYISGVRDGAVELYYDNSKKLETYSSGVQVTGTLFIPDGSSTTNRISIGGSGDLKLYHDGTNSLLTNATNDLRIRSNSLKLQSITGEEYLTGTADGSVNIFHNNVVKLTTNTDGYRSNDNVKAQFGDSSDLEIFHDGSHSRIKDTGTGGLYTSASIFKITNAAVTENMFLATEDSAVELYYDNSKKLETSNTGAKFTGWLYADDNAQIRLGNGADLQIYHDASDSFVSDQGTGSLRLLSNAFKVMNAANNEAQIYANENGAVELYYDNSKKFETLTNGSKVSGNLYVEDAGTHFKSNQISFQPAGTAYIDHTTVDQDIVFRTSDASALDTTALTIDASDAGTAIFNHDVKIPDNGKFIAGAGDDLQIFHDGSNSYIDESGTGSLLLRATPSIEFRKAGGTEKMLYAEPDAQVELYYDNSKRFSTLSAGAEVTGSGFLTFSIKSTNSDAVLLLESGGDAETDWTIRNDESESNKLAFRFNNNTRAHLSSSGDLWISGNFDLSDNDKVRLGTGDDLQLYHSGSNSFIKHVGTGDLFVQCDNGEDIYLRPKANEDGVKVISDGAVELYYDNSKKLHTFTGGVKFFGTLEADDSDKIKLGDNADLELYHDGTHSYIQNSTGNLYLRATTTETGISVIPNGAVKLFYDNSAKLETKSNGVEFSDNTFHVDNKAAHFGTGNDLYILHDGTNSFVTNSTGAMLHRADDFRIQNGAGSEVMLDAAANGAVNLYYDNALKLNTHADGIKLQDNTYLPDNKKLILGGGNDLQIFHNGTNSIIDNNTGILSIQGDDVRIQNSAGGETGIRYIADGAVELYYDNDKKLNTTSTGVNITDSVYVANSRLLVGTSTNTSPIGWNNNLQVAGTDAQAGISIRRDSDNTSGALLVFGKSRGSLNGNTVVQDGDSLGSIFFAGADGTDVNTVAAQIAVQVDGTPGSNDMPGRIVFKTTPDGSTSAAERLRIASDGEATFAGNVSLGETLTITGANPNITFVDSDDNPDYKIYASNQVLTVLDSTNSVNALTLNKDAATFAGTVTCTSLTETSDIALKTNIEPITNVLDKINQITGYKYDFTKSNSSSIGVIAQDVEKVFPELVHGEEGSKSLQYSGLIGALIESVKELSAKVAALEAGS